MLYVAWVMNFLNSRRHCNWNFFSKIVGNSRSIQSGVFFFVVFFFKDVPRKYCSWPAVSIRSLSSSAFCSSLPFFFFFYCLLPYFQLPASQIIKCQSSDTWHFNERSVFTTRSLSTALLLSMRARCCAAELKRFFVVELDELKKDRTRAAAQSWEEGGSRFPNVSPGHLLKFMSSIQLNKHLFRP